MCTMLGHSYVVVFVRCSFLSCRFLAYQSFYGTTLKSENKWEFVSSLLLTSGLFLRCLRYLPTSSKMGHFQDQIPIITISFHFAFFEICQPCLYVGGTPTMMVNNCRDMKEQVLLALM